MCFDVSQLQPVPTLKRGDRALFWDDDESKAEPEIYLCEIPGLKYPFYSVGEQYEEEFRRYESGESSTCFGASCWRHCKPIPQEVHFTLPAEDAQRIKRYMECGIPSLERILNNIAKQVK